ncbi:MAG: hypothetical protein ACTSUE_26190 [Promethearchaeota archaeon]
MIRLIIFDFGDTIFHAEPDSRSRGTGTWEVLDRDAFGHPTCVAPPDRIGMVEKTFEHAQEVLRELRKQDIWLSVASSADVIYTPQMVEAFEMGALFRHAFMARGDWNQDCSRKGDWIEAIIHDFNIGELQDDPLSPGEVLFVDDLQRCLNAAKKKVPGIQLCMSFPRTDDGMKYLFHVLEEFNE